MAEEKPKYNFRQVGIYLDAYNSLCMTRDKAKAILRRFPALPQIREQTDEEDPIADSESRTNVYTRREALRDLIRDYTTYRDMIPKEFWDREPLKGLIKEILSIFK
ncbi:MAG: hypothetical protein AABX23_04900 [Nanoarchaeota archaeon]